MVVDGRRENAAVIYKWSTLSIVNFLWVPQSSNTGWLLVRLGSVMTDPGVTYWNPCRRPVY